MSRSYRADKWNVMPDPPYIEALFSSTRFAWLWTLVRLYVGWTWLKSGLGKLSNPAWMDGGAALRGFWMNVTAVPEGGRPAITYGWYRNFLTTLLESDAYSWMAPIIVWGEILIGAGLLLGALTGFAAFFGAFLNFNFMLAGTASTNPVLFVLAILLLLAWKTAGWYGLDRWLLPFLGTPWGGGALRNRRLL